MELKKAIINKVAATKRRLQPHEVMEEISSSLGVSTKEVKRAMSELVLEGKLEFTYYGQSFVELPLGMRRRDLPKSPSEEEPSA